MFEKEHAATWTEEIFKIKEVINKRSPPTFIIEDLLGEEIKGKFYKEQLQKVQLPTSFIVEKIHRRRKRKYWLVGEGTPKNSCNGYHRRTYK